MGEAATFCAYNIDPKPGQNAIVGRSGSGAIWTANPVSPELPAPVGAVGEILIEGPHLSRGYLDKLCLKPDAATAPASSSPLHNGSRICTRLEPALVAFLYLAGNPMNLSPAAPSDALSLSFVPITARYRANALVETISADIKATLPAFMLPSLFLLVDKIPRTRSNKTDRRKLHQVAQKWYMSNRVCIYI